MFPVTQFHYEKRMFLCEEIRNQGGGNIAPDTSNYLWKRSKKQFEKQDIDISTISILENSKNMKDMCDKKRYLDHDQLLISIPLESLQTIKDQDSQLYVHQSFALPYLDSKSNADSTIQQSPASKFSKNKSRSNILKYKIKKTSSIRIIPPNDKTEKLIPLSYDDFRYRPVNSD